MTFPGYPPESLHFLRSLRDNNTREWFQENKKTYEAEVRDPTKIFTAELADAVEKLTGDPQKSKIFRINRDVRFSKDKTPYNSHVHISFLPQIDVASPPAFMFGWSPDYLTLGCGVFEFEKDALIRFREFVASDAGAEFQKMLSKLQKSDLRLSEPALKRVPSVYPADHPRGDLLKHKGIAVWLDRGGPEDAVGERLVKKCASGFKRLMPLYEALKAI